MKLKHPSDFWIMRTHPRPDALLRLYCFPYAGGGASLYRQWATVFPPSVEVCAVRLPGRESRILEPPFTDIHKLVAYLSDCLLEAADKPFAFFGHSMGALISYELARSLFAKKQASPIHIFVSGCRAPHLPYQRHSWHTLSENQLIQLLSRLKGIPIEVLENAELLQVILPMLRADLQMIDCYAWEPSPKLLCALTAFGSWHDPDVTSIETVAWREYTQAAFSVQMFNGNHFFIHSEQAALITAVKERLETTYRAIFYRSL